jgi:hypothetical protein
MATGDPPDRQKEHAREIRAETGLMRRLGTTREQARQVLQQDAQRMREDLAAKERAKTEESTAAPKPPLTIETTTQSFEPKAFTLAGDSDRPPPQTSPGQTLLKNLIFYDVLGGVWRYTNVYTDGTSNSFPS